jgi:hypothetical protein
MPYAKIFSLHAGLRGVRHSVEENLGTRHTANCKKPMSEFHRQILDFDELVI